MKYRYMYITDFEKKIRNDNLKVNLYQIESR